MKRLSLLCLMLGVLMAVTISHAQTSNDTSDYIVIHIFNATAVPQTVYVDDHESFIPPYRTVTRYIQQAGTSVTLNDDDAPLDYLFEVGFQHLLVLHNPSEANDFRHYQVIGLNYAGELVSDEAQSIWWIGNLFDEASEITILVEGEQVFDPLTPGAWNYFSAPLNQFELILKLNGETIFITDEGFGEPYYTTVIGLAGVPSPRSYQTLAVDIVTTDLFTWLEALTALNINPYTYGEFTSWVARAGGRSAFLMDDRVVLLPYDSAFMRLSRPTYTRLMDDDAYLNRLLANHLLVRSELPLDPEAPLMTLDKTALPVGFRSGALRIGDSTYITRMYLPNASEAWLIDGVMLPPER